MTKCATKKCNNEGFLSFKGRADLKFCQGCYQYVARKMARWNAEMRAIRAARRAETEDNQPARICPEM
jgi:hypothetical protein